MAVSPSAGGENTAADANVRRTSRYVCGGILFILTGALLLLVPHPNRSGADARSHSLWNMLTAVCLLGAFGLTLLAFRARPRYWTDAGRLLLRRYAFWFWLSVWLFLEALCFGVYLVTADDEFLRSGLLMLGAGICAWWAVFCFAGRSIRLLTNAALAGTVSVVACLAVELLLALLPLTGTGLESWRAESIKLCEFQRWDRAGRAGYGSALTADPELGYRQRENFTVTLRSPTGIGTIEKKTDAFGFFNADCDSSHPCDVACLGDSFVAWGWPAMLARKTGLRVAALAQPGYAPPQYTVLLKRYALRLKPKVVFYCIYANDAYDSAQYEDWRKSGLDWFTFRGRTWFDLSPGHPGRLLLREYLLRCSRLFALLEFSRFTRNKQNQPVTAQPLVYHGDRFNLIFDRANFTSLTDLKSEMVKRGLEVIRRNLEEARRVCDEAHVQLWVFLFPPKELVHFEALKKLAKPDDPVENLPEFYETLRRMCEELHVTYCDVTERFREEAARSGKALYNKDTDIHWDDDGMALMADIAAGRLAALPELRPGTK